jgi:carbon monoxide dehydrogenase subunit G
VAIQIDKSFVVRATPAAVWEVLTDPHQVATFLPGAEITEQVDDKTYSGSITVKVGPVTSSYKGKVIFERLDRENWEVELSARGMDIRGKGGADMRMTSKLIEKSGGETEVTVNSQVNVTGLLAQLGRGMIQDVSDQMFQRFTTAMKTELEAPTGPDPASAASPVEEQEPIEVLSFGGAVIGRAIGRVLNRPEFWIALAVLALAIVFFSIVT